MRQINPICTPCRICDEDGAVLEEQEQFVELTSSKLILQQLESLVASGAKDRLIALPDSIHSCLPRSTYRGVYFYFTALDQNTATSHFWHCNDLKQQILDHRFLIAILVICVPDIERTICEADVFAIQAKVQQQPLLEVPKSKVTQSISPAIQPSATRQAFAIDDLRLVCREYEWS